jgi:DNA polymerase-3 subunit epsilon
MYPIAHPKVIQRAREFLAFDPLFLDTETTGISPQDVVIEVGVVDLAGETVYETLIRPSIPIPAEAVAIHGITEGMVSDAPAWREIWGDLRSVLDGRYVGVYNADFDLRMMKQTHRRSWLDWTLEDQRFFCVMKLYSAFYGERSLRGNSFRFHKLEAAGAACRIPLPNSHRAVDDARLTAALFKYIAHYGA